MTYTSIFEKLLFIFSVIGTSWIYIVFSLFTVFFVMLLVLKKISKRVYFLLEMFATILVLGYTICINYDAISKMVNTIVDNIFLNIYFPSAYVYLFVLIVIDVVTIASFLNPRGEKIYRTVNYVCFIISNFILALVLEIIAKDKVEVLIKESIFANTDLVTLLEFGVNVFIIWIISLIAIYFINNITERIVIARENKKLVSEPVSAINTDISVSMPELEKEYHAVTALDESVINEPVQAILSDNNENKFIPNFTVEVNDVVEDLEMVVSDTTVEPIRESSSYNNSFDLSAFIPKKQEVKPISILNNQTNTNTSTNTNQTKQIFEQILNNELPVIKEEIKQKNNFEDAKDTYTLNDYRIFNKMLKDIREHNGSNSITIDKNLEYRLITKYSTETYNMFKTMLKIYSN